MTKSKCIIFNALSYLYANYFIGDFDELKRLKSERHKIKTSYGSNREHKNESLQEGK